MAMGTERSKALHNFTMPCELRWGNQRFLRCMKVNSNGQVSTIHRFTNSDSGDHHRCHSIQQRRTTRDGDRERYRGPSSDFVYGCRKVSTSHPPAPGGRRGFIDEGQDDDGIAAMREKVIFDLQTAADKMKHAIFKNRLEEHEVTVSPPAAPAPAALSPPPISAECETSRPWNLRTRQVGYKTQVSRVVAGRNGVGNEGPGGKELRLDVSRPMAIPQVRAEAATAAAVADKSLRLRNGQKGERPKFSLALSKREIEEDFVGITGHRPPRRPKKRAKNVQKQLDLLFPGVFLTEITPDLYKVNEPAP